MPSSPLISIGTRRSRPDTRTLSDMRRHRRVQLSLQGRFMCADRSEHPCELRDISVGGASVLGEHPVEVGEKIVTYFQDLGGLEGMVTRNFEGGFAMQFKITPNKREKLAAQITWLLNRDAFPAAMSRLNERVGTIGRKAVLRFADGLVIDVDVLDMSTSGCSVTTTARPHLGAEIFVGKIKAFVSRHHEQGISLQFAETRDVGTLELGIF